MTFILVEPRLPENLGAAARALKTMGFSNLRLVNPCDPLSERARWVAHGSQDILEQALIFDNLTDAVADLDFLIGTTIRRRSFRRQYLDARKLPEFLQRKGNAVHRVGLLFGREESGLYNDELELCDLLTTVPQAVSYPSLNLAQAVMVYAFILSSHDLEERRPADAGEYAALRERVAALCRRVGYTEKPDLFTRLMERMALIEAQDVRLLHSLCKKIERALDRESSS
ncbi:MAG: tRNA/rRNA methyltransferase [candidate division KSB1 bacterium]|nr:tRNA/rRNA methyltransferase [candidate division KSB1 bacterium]